jgi:hypothetical protein
MTKIALKHLAQDPHYKVMPACYIVAQKQAQ